MRTSEVRGEELNTEEPEDVPEVKEPVNEEMNEVNHEAYEAKSQESKRDSAEEVAGGKDSEIQKMNEGESRSAEEVKSGDAKHGMACARRLVGLWQHPRPEQEMQSVQQTTPSTKASKRG